MRINADFSARAFIAGDQHEWVPSPQPGVHRVMLDRVGAEKARATSLVRYAPGSQFSPHAHPGGEEILVLEGTFSDETGDCPAGFYMRNPPGSSHQPFSHEGALIFVKLWQMSPAQNENVRVNTLEEKHWQRESGMSVCHLYSSGAEQVRLFRLTAAACLPVGDAGGVELFVVDGDGVLEGRTWPQGSWLRFPRGDQTQWTAGAQGCTVYVKTGHLG